MSVLDKWNARLDKLHSYMDKVIESEPEFSQVVITSKELLHQLIEVVSILDLTLSIPNACPGGDKHFMYVWREGHHYLECEVFDNRAEFFYVNEETDDTWAMDLPGDEDDVRELLEKLVLFSSKE